MKCFIASACVLLVLSRVGKVQGGAGWEYDGDLGPDEWHVDFEKCGGRMQSPINVNTNRVLFNRDLQSFDLRGYANIQGVTMKLENVDGHTVEVVYGGTPIVIRGGNLPDDYVLDQFHFHWGTDNSRGSEHTVNNNTAPMEMHIVHHMNKYNSSKVAAANPYGLAVLGFFFQVGAHNPGFEALLSNFPDVVHKDANKSITPFSLLNLVGNTGSGHYFRYYGSLTTPPCYETVIWTLYTDKITISQQQMDTFRTLRNRREGDTTEKPISDDFRPTQPLHERSVTTNDPSLLNDATSYMFAKLEQDIQQLTKKCATAGSSSVGGLPRAASASLAVLFCWLAVFGLV